MAIVLLPLALALIGALASVRSAPTSPPAIVILATPTLPARPAPALAVAAAGPLARTTTRAVIAYSAPDPASPIGALEPGRAYTPTAQIGDAWLAADVAGSGAVYLQIAELYGLANLPRTAEPAAAPIIVVEPPQFEIMAVPTAPPAPAPTALPPMYTGETIEMYLARTGGHADQADPRCTGAIDDTIAPDCGLDRALLREAEER